MEKKENKNVKISENACGCSIDDLIGEGCGENKKNPKISNERLCSAHESDFEVFVDPDIEKTNNDFYMRKITDGLPIIPPTKARVQKFLGYTDRKSDDVIAVLPPKRGKATVEKIAVNSVMAGCIPSFTPIVQKAVEAVSQEKFNLPGVNATTHPVAVCTLLNGPVSRELAVNSGAGCLGPGNIANATIGRALRLCLMNIGGAVPGIGDHATMGSPAKYSYAFAEAESESPWKPLHVERGFDVETSTVTVMAVEAPQNVNDHRSSTAEDLLDTIVHTASTAGCNNSHVPGEILVVMSPEHAETVAGDGWDRTDVENYIHENAAVPVELADRGGRKLDKDWIVGDDVRITRSPGDVVLVVAGGAGRHTMIAHGFGTSSESVTMPLTLKNGDPVHSIREFQGL
ncbi:hypothetical protein [Methanobacterium paludis]|uniref:Uncharacterized protein n=1 Tax=Methanobacterium paludis (strain DSM 25820 / JCM 18151 / SWAN1) TaxID=868131 RepID=F6D7S1_METPW|nr:hypothetical protein [Methanobacterium paludis]AEG17150.1 hypothetical protein MSWAN_0103 [Methanobacterium paludis]